MSLIGKLQCKRESEVSWLGISYSVMSCLKTEGKAEGKLSEEHPANASDAESMSFSKCGKQQFWVLDFFLQGQHGKCFK